LGNISGVRLRPKEDSVSRSHLIVLALVCVTALTLGSSAEETDGPATIPPHGESAPPIHADHDKLMKDFTTASAAAILDDTKGMIDALERVAADCRRVHDPADERYPKVVRSHSQAFHAVIAATKLRAAALFDAGDVEAEIEELLIDDVFREYQWVERGCRICHGQAAQLGLYPAKTE
jgi:hypothetical protein